MTLFVAGLSHKNAPVELREQLAVEEDKLRELLRDVAATGAVQETLILSTCNRVEVYGVARRRARRGPSCSATSAATAASATRRSSRSCTRTWTTTPCATPFGSPRASTRC